MGTGRRTNIPKKIKDFLLIASKHQCSICQDKTIDVHHIIAVADGGTNELDNLMVVCHNHHREYHQGRYSADQMRTYRTQWIQKCNIFSQIGIPTELLVKDRSIASNLPLATKLQFIEQYGNCIIENISVGDDGICLYYQSLTQTNSEITHQNLLLLQMIFRFFIGYKTITCVRPHTTQNQLYYGLDTPEHYSYSTRMRDVEAFIFGKVSIHEFWENITFFRKKRVDIRDNKVEAINLRWVGQ